MAAPSRLAGAVSLFLFIAISTAAAAAPASRPSDAQLLQMLATRVDLQKQATGIVVGIAEPGGNRVLSYGTLGLNDKRPVTARTVFDVGSITKVLTALVLADMVERHEVALDAPVTKYLRDIALPTQGGRQITLADLATHTSGLPLRPANLPSNDPADPYARYTRADLHAFLTTTTLAHVPGSTYDYSNVGYGLLGDALSVRANQAYGALVATRITDPLGMGDTRLVPSDDMAARAAMGYDGSLQPVPHWHMGALESAGGFRSTAADLLKLLDAFLGFRRTPLAPAMALTTGTRRPGGMSPATAIALAWNIYADNGREIVWKNGSVGGFRAFVGFDRKARTGIVGLANAQTGSGVDDIGLHYLDPSYPVDLEIPRAHTEVTLSHGVLDQFVGRYKFSPTDMLTVLRNGDRLSIVIAPGQPPIEIYAEGDGRFFLKVVNVQLTFTDLKNGHASKVVWHQSGQDQTGERIE